MIQLPYQMQLSECVCVCCRFKLEGDTKSWLEIDPATGEIKTKAKLDREVLEAFDVTVIAFEKGEKHSQ